ncbi:nitronate monooxygenase [Paractinoplanes durhamensis]|uniref:nitronate monooxygenase n=1 Tax=Paractinoplanes durhamensis TaxID=113563 RepID=UPI00362FA3EA
MIAVTGGTGIEPSPYLAAAATAAGATGIVDLGTGETWTLRLLRLAAARSSEPIGVRVGARCTATLAEVRAATGGHLAAVVLTADAAWPRTDLAGETILVEVTDLDEARAAVAAGAHGLIARGMESAGRTSDLSTFVLLQSLLDAMGETPVWAAGGIGPRTTAAVVAAGAAGVLLDSQLLLMPEADLPDHSRAALARTDGTETTAQREAAGLLGVGADGALAAAFAARWADTGTAIRAIRAAAGEDFAAAAGLLAPGGPLAAALGVDLPIAQGPMTRVSDEPAFAAAVAAEGRCRSSRSPSPTPPRPSRCWPGRRRRWATGRGGGHSRVRARPREGRADRGDPAGAPGVRHHRRRPPGAGESAGGRRHPVVPARAVARAAQAVPRGGQPPFRLRRRRMRWPCRAAGQLPALGDAARGARLLPGRASRRRR